MKIEYSHIPAEKFRFVQQGKRLLDDGPATKQRGYFRDALQRFCKDKSAVTAAVLILGFWALQIPYGPVWGLLVAFVDALPVLGTPSSLPS